MIAVKCENRLLSDEFRLQHRPYHRPPDGFDVPVASSFPKLCGMFPKWVQTWFVIELRGNGLIHSTRDLL